MASEDEVDTETLQAQIDLSMSFMHGLVSSWIKPGSKQPTRSDRNSKLEDELKESMKRPPRYVAVHFFFLKKSQLLNC
jgi:hypothetical protein